MKLNINMLCVLCCLSPGSCWYCIFFWIYYWTCDWCWICQEVVTWEWEPAYLLPALFAITLTVADILFVYVCLKVPMKWKIIAGYLKGFSKYRRMALSFLKYQTWCQKCTSQKKQNDTCGAVAMTTVLLLVLSKLELKVPVFVLTNYHPLPAI